MKPVAILRHSVTEGPGYFATVLDKHGIPWQMTRIDAGDAVPEDALEFAGLCLMGGPMSANDDLPWIAQALALIRAAVGAGVPVIGHCLGGQLMAKALGGTVSRNPVKEIGWGSVSVPENAEALRWFGGLRGFFAFHWHGETFSIPANATRILESSHCANQAFALGPHLALQCHVEMTPELIHAWCREWDKEVTALSQRAPSVQTPSEILEQIEPRLKALHAVADRLYERWIEGLKR
ncbi:MAG: type 1 glutamine amidotransferase [Betaproteobacteria bacterium]|nr:type 1 glutamine amidotransferase [Betaproteobacteria bacterium]